MRATFQNVAMSLSMTLIFTLDRRAPGLDRGTTNEAALRRRRQAMELTLERARTAPVVMSRLKTLARPTGFHFPDAIPVERRIPVRGAVAWREVVARRAWAG